MGRTRTYIEQHGLEFVMRLLLIRDSDVSRVASIVTAGGEDALRAAREEARIRGILRPCDLPVCDVPAQACSPGEPPAPPVNPSPAPPVPQLGRPGPAGPAIEPTTACAIGPDDGLTEEARLIIWARELPLALPALRPDQRAAYAGIAGNEQRWRTAIARTPCAVAPLALETGQSSKRPAGRIELDAWTDKTSRDILLRFDAAEAAPTGYGYPAVWKPRWLKYFRSEPAVHDLFEAMVKAEARPLLRYFSIGSTCRYLGNSKLMNPSRPVAAADLPVTWADLRRQYALIGLRAQVQQFLLYLGPNPPSVHNEPAMIAWLQAKQTGISLEFATAYWHNRAKPFAMRYLSAETKK